MKSIFTGIWAGVLFLALSTVSFADDNMDGKGQPTETREDTTLLKEMPKPTKSEAAPAPKKHGKKKTQHRKTKTPPPVH